MRLFQELFAGRTDVVGLDNGGCKRVLLEDWPKLWHDHLEGDTPIGVYPIMPNNTVWWGCVDVDTGNKPGAMYDTWWDAWRHCQLLQRVLNHLNIRSWLEVTRSLGVHVWVFANEPVPAITMRHALLAAHQIVDLPQKEVNPKQETLPPNKVGNYVRLPYTSSSEYQYIAVNGWNIPSLPHALELEDFLQEAHAQRTSLHTLQQAADLYRRPVVSVVSTGSRELGDIKNRSAYAAKLIEHGPFGTDRSKYLWLVARTLCEARIPFDVAWEAICEADRRHGKFLTADRADDLHALLAKAYQ